MTTSLVTKITLALLCLCLTLKFISATNTTNTSQLANEDRYKCKDGIFIPMWLPEKDIALSDRIARAIVYFLAMCYMFLGVSIIADRFMSSIEVITAKEKEITVTKPSGETVTIHIKVWNETVSNLTLMALGSSAPEIMLSALEVVGRDFQAGELGPGTIVGSAAFNLFVIISICIYVIPDDELRRIKHLRVFFVTASWSLVAYIWLYLMIAQISPGEIHIWEGVVTLALFPITVLTAFFADKYLMPKHVAHMYRASRHQGVMIEAEDETDIEHAAHHAHKGNGVHKPYHVSGDMILGEGQVVNDEIVMFEQHRTEYINILRDLRHKHPNMAMTDLEELAEGEVMNRGPKSRAYYRILATRKLTGGGGNIIKQRLEKEQAMKDSKEECKTDSKVTTVHFEPAHYTVLENVGTFQITVRREGNLHNTVYVDYKTEDGTANAGSDYEPIQGTLIFEPGQIDKQISITIVDDDIFEEDEHFYVKLGNLWYANQETGGKIPATYDCGVLLGTPAVATIMILDDDHAGVIHFEEEVHVASESIGDCHVLLRRSTGARGYVSVAYKTYDITAVAGKDYKASEGDIVFNNDEFEKYITIEITDSETYKKNVKFGIEIFDPRLVRSAAGFEVEGCPTPQKADPNDMTEDERVAEMGKPRLGDITKIQIDITESEEFRKTVDKMMDHGNTAILVGTSSWVEQFKAAVTVGAACEQTYGQGQGDDDDDKKEGEGEGEETLPSCADHVMHYVSLFWKILFATVPPTDYAGGWLCFVVSIIWIGILTGLISDIASSFGCTVQLLDSVNAITFVALGTSVPDTFASKVAAIGDRYADSSIGNVTGSNAVNVFLGIGVAWTMAAVVNFARGTPFKVKQGSLAFSLTIYVAFAITAIILLIVRRNKYIGGELGGPKKAKVLSSLFLFMLWVTYITLSALEAYEVIPGF